VGGILKEMAPHLSHVALIFNPGTAPAIGCAWSRSNFGAHAERLEIERGLETVAGQSNSGPIIVPDLCTSGDRELILTLAARHRLPAIYPFRFFVAHGGLLSYGVDTLDLFRRSASFIHRIPKGDKPSDLPVQAPTKFELVINLRTAKALGLEVPQLLPAQASEVIERGLLTSDFGTLAKCRRGLKLSVYRGRSEVISVRRLQGRCES